MCRLVAAAAVLALACTKADPPGGTDTSSSAAPPRAAVVAPQASAPGAAPVVSTGVWTGTYQAKASTLYLPDTPEMKRVKWRGDEATAGLGAGDLSLTFDPDGRVHGESKGALGTLAVEGRVDGERVAATLRPMNAEDGFTGTLEGTKKGNALGGLMNLTDYNAGLLRAATFALTAK